ncbi:Immunoglobulin I-set domain [Popillia japonica]|uniref:Immunoglobulin I-set domain n=1 Tax=Popillia japonica TaxID=7064 RepID=A0AAW1N6X6_POPJA
MALQRFYAVLSVLSSLIAVSYSQRTPTISYISQEQYKDIGGTAELVCSVQYLGDYPLIWMKQDGQNSIPISSASNLLVHDSRFSIRHDKESSTFTLQIKDIQETDVGTYTCQVSTSLHNRVTAHVQLIVRRPPLISDNSTRSVIVSENQPVDLECYASGFPTPKISWRRENNAVLPTGGSIYRGNILKIKRVRKEDRGTYYCIADNSVGKGTRRNINIEVEFAPVVTIPRPRVGQALQYDMDMECHIEAYPLPGITWLKEGIVLSTNQHYSIATFGAAEEYTDSTLRAITIEKRQYGKYICKAANKLGTAQAEVELFETIIPVCPPACDQYQRGDAVSLSRSSIVVFGVSLLLMFSEH